MNVTRYQSSNPCGILGNRRKYCLCNVTFYLAPIVRVDHELCFHTRLSSTEHEWSSTVRVKVGIVSFIATFNICSL